MNTIAPKINSIFTTVPNPPAPKQRILIVGKMEDDGASQDKKLTQEVTLTQAKELYGVNSLIYDSLKEYRGVDNEDDKNPSGDMVSIVDIFPVKSTVEGTPAVGSILFTGQLNTNTPHSIKVSLVKKGGGSFKNKGNLHVEVIASPGDTGEEVTTAVALALSNAISNEDMVSIIQDVDTKIVTITSKVNSSVCNDFIINVEIEGINTGLEVEVEKMTGGACTYDLTLAELENEIKGIEYNILWINNDIDCSILSTLIANRKNVEYNTAVSGVGIVSKLGTKQELQDFVETFQEDGVACIVDSKENGLDSFLGTPSYLLATNLMQVMSLRQTDNANISNIIRNKATDLQFGSVKTLSIPLTNTILHNVPYRKEAVLNGYSQDFTPVEKYALQDLGLSFLQNDNVVNKTVLGNIVSTSYSTTGEELLDYLIKIYLSKDLFRKMEAMTLQHGITTGSQPVDNNGIIPLSTIKTYLLSTYFEDIRAIGLLNNSEDSINTTAQSLVVDFNNGLLDISYTAVLFHKLRAVNINATFNKGN